MVVQPVAWDCAVLLEQNRVRLLKDLATTIRMYEARDELPSARLEEELAAGRIRETAEICHWLIDWHTYQALMEDAPHGPSSPLF